MSSLPLVFAHGLEGAPQGTKISALRAAGLNVVAPDGRGLPLAERIAGLEAATRDGGVVLGGSSYGGLAAAWLASQYPQRFLGLLLCAPALHHSEAPALHPDQIVIAPTIPTWILHGAHDDIVPIGVSQALQQRSGAHVTLEAVEDDHRLVSSIPRLVEIARALTAEAAPATR